MSASVSPFLRRDLCCRRGGAIPELRDERVRSPGGVVVAAAVVRDQRQVAAICVDGVDVAARRGVGSEGDLLAVRRPARHVTAVPRAIRADATTGKTLNFDLVQAAAVGMYDPKRPADVG